VNVQTGINTARVEVEEPVAVEGWGGRRRQRKKKRRRVDRGGCGSFGRSASVERGCS
jgi:hypothetical protein